MLFLLNNWKLIVAGIGVLAILGGLWYYGHTKYNDGYSSCKAEYESKLIAANDAIKTRKKIIKHETQSLDRAGIIAELCRGGWVRSFENCPH